MRNLISVFFLIIMSLSASAQVAERAEHAYRTDELIVRFARQAEKSNRGNLIAKAGAKAIKREFGDRYAIVDVSEATLEQVLKTLRSDPAIEAVERNYIGRGGYEPVDRLFPSQWHLKQNNHVDINATQAWDRTRGNPGIRVAIVDSGVKPDHPEFAGRLFVNRAESANGLDDDGNGLVDDINGWDFVDSDGNPDDAHGHGTWVTSVFGANAGDGFGVVGVDHFAEILPLKILNAENEGMLSDLIEAIDYAVAQGADIINLSLVDFPRSEMLGDALDRADSQGSIIVACAGNSGPDSADLQYPSAHPAVITVGATQANDEIAHFSSTGQSVDLVAPGQSILAADHQEPFEPDVASSVSGCSLATPIVAGVVSLLLAEDPELTRDEIMEILAISAVDLGEPGWDKTYGWGRIDAAAALRHVFGAPVALPPMNGMVSGDSEPVIRVPVDPQR